MVFWIICAFVAGIFLTPILDSADNNACRMAKALKPNANVPCEIK